jgi:hypothetical protein
MKLGYWKDITVIVEDELNKLHKLDNKRAYEAGTGLYHFSCGTLVWFAVMFKYS